MDINNQITNVQLDSVTAEIGDKLMSCILDHIGKSQLTVGQGQELAKAFVSERENKNKEQLVQLLNELGKHYPVAQEAYLSYAKPQDEHDRSARLTELTTLIQQGNIQEAIKRLHEEK